MLTVEVKKLFRNIVSVRDYIVRKCIKKGIPLRVFYKGQQMDLTLDDLKSKAFQTTKRSFNSKFNNQKYQLIDFNWNPGNGVEK